MFRMIRYPLYLIEDFLFFLFFFFFLCGKILEVLLERSKKKKAKSCEI